MHVYWFLGRGREGGRGGQREGWERNINQLPPTQLRIKPSTEVCALTKNWTHNPFGVWEYVSTNWTTQSGLLWFCVLFFCFQNSSHFTILKFSIYLPTAIHYLGLKLGIASNKISLSVHVPLLSLDHIWFPFFVPHDTLYYVLFIPLIILPYCLLTCRY